MSPPKAVQDVQRLLSERFRGRMLQPGDPTYSDGTRVWNGMFDSRPALIARCRDIEDVQSAIRAGSVSEITTAVRCGGHSLAGFSTCENGLVIDLSGMRQVEVNAGARTARFGGGCLLGTVDRETQKFGLAFPAGVVSHTGAGGLVLGGGTGWLNRLHGLSCDNVETFTVVTADGSVVRADAQRNSDLFWALRGGGGNFGVVTEFEVRLHPIRSAVFGKGQCAIAHVPDLLRYWREYMKSAPDGLRWGFSLRVAGEGEQVPAELRNKPVASASALWLGDKDEGISFVSHALSAEPHHAVTIEEIPFLRLQTMADTDFPHGRRYYTKSGYFLTLEDRVIEILLASLQEIPSKLSEVELSYLGGVAARVGAGETAFGDRSAPFILNILSHWTDPAADLANMSWARRLFADLRPWMRPGVYVNFMSGDEVERVSEAYRERWDRLREIKTKYDPRNFFRRNQNIPPL
jgi:hypothetical protein